MIRFLFSLFFFFFNDTATTEIYTLSLHDALPISSAQAKEVSAKLAVLERTRNGFEVAEADWELRGPGDLLGTAQSGLPALKIGNLKTDANLMRRARAAALSIFEADPHLEWPENQRFRTLIVI